MPQLGLHWFMEEIRWSRMESTELVKGHSGAEAAPIHFCLPSVCTPLTLVLFLHTHSPLKTKMFPAALVWLHMMVPRMTFKAQTGIQHWSSMSGFRWPCQERMTKQDGRLGSFKIAAQNSSRGFQKWRLLPAQASLLSARAAPHLGKWWTIKHCPKSSFRV